ncbi:ribose ABC transporter permease [Bacillus sp. AFS076308]|uniref:ABC transporter permease n=1 Tax=unclassified Bacillus (in: firmicutes) TaxID=185979 RepID=UPI000BF9224D|nr:MULTISPECIES: ABC transporter permease [unclassified Bacillus (in: firmicutes)]PFN99588.1 ribose ABC transporter permease [Bacillus sp. AFS076308]PGV50234.1 ribose ABC transporter permease [Bacillus sp. AFS037270]
MINTKIAENSSKTSKDKQSLLSFFKLDGVGVFIILILLSLFLTVMIPSFLTFDNISNLLVQSIFIMIIAFGMMFVLSTGGIDLSVGSVLGLTGGVTGWLMMSGLNMWIAILGGLILGFLIGLINGVIITKLKISAFLVTFAMLYIARGLLTLLTKEEPISSFATPGFVFLAQGDVLGIPMPFLITLVLFFLLYFLFKFTKYGRFIIATGSNKEAARLSGVSTDRINISVYALSGLLASVAGILLTSRLTSVQPLMGNGYELYAIAAAAIGGTSMFGGKASMVGVMMGSLILGLIANGLDLLLVDQFYRLIITGIIIIIAVAIERYLSRKS